MQWALLTMFSLRGGPSYEGDCTEPSFSLKRPAQVHSVRNGLEQPDLMIRTLAERLNRKCDYIHWAATHATSMQALATYSVC